MMYVYLTAQLGFSLWSGQVMRGSPTRLRCFEGGIFLLEYVALRVISKGAVKRQLEFYYGSLIRLFLHNVPVCLW